jgi:hypothetical protein
MIGEVPPKSLRYSFSYSLCGWNVGLDKLR